MSLDVTLSGDDYEEPCRCECGHEHTRIKSQEYHSSNITHNLGLMAKAAGIYQHLWRPEELGITKAGQLITPLQEGLALLESDPDRFKEFNSPNGWGMYEHFVPFVRNYLAACEAHPEATVSVSR